MTVQEQREVQNMIPSCSKSKSECTDMCFKNGCRGGTRDFSWMKSFKITKQSLSTEIPKKLMKEQL